jgi:thioredoxin reductase (NADPH)
MAEYDLLSIAFPTLDEAQVARLSGCAAALPRVCEDGQTLFTVGDRDQNFFVVKSGEVEIVDHSGDEPRRLTVHRRGQFTGEVSQLTGAPAVATAVARGRCEVYEISGEGLRSVLNLCPDLSDVILQAFIARRQLLHQSPTFIGLRVIGSRFSPDTLRVRDFLARNRVLFTWVDVETNPQVDRLLREFGVTEADTPVVACAHLLMLRNPSNRQLADAVGIHRPLEQEIYDLAVVGAGPAGLAAAVYGASEGLRTVVLEQTAPGGQAGSSMRIENYLGFPTGLTGSELAGRAVLQANKFGARLSVSTPVTRLEFHQAYPVLCLEDGETVAAKCLLIATGAEYRRLEAEGGPRYEGTGVYYAATPNEAQLCRGAQVVLVGGGNSAGQAAVFLAGQARTVWLVLRGDDLYRSMSSYLARRIEQTANIEVLRNTQVRRMRGDGHLAAVDVVDSKTGEQRTLPTPALFSFIGAVPRTDWLPPEVERDARGFVRTGPALASSPYWTARRQPFLLETSRPGVFAAGDVRSGSVKRVASAVGEGAMAVQLVHEYLKEM